MPKIWNPLRRRAPLNLALQGGGAHGAFTWGVLDALLEAGRFELAAISGASAGAMNTVALAQGLMEGGPKQARAALERFWTAIGSEVAFEWLTIRSDDSIELSPTARLMMRWMQNLSPKQFNPLDRNPLRDILAEQIDFDALRRHAGPQLYISATHANSGRLRLFTRDELSLEAVLASACLPTLHHTVMIDGQPYWDGGFSANPALYPRVWNAGSAPDTLLVLLAPLEHEHTPTTAAQIRERVLDISFNSTFLRELRTLAEVQARLARAWLPLGSMERRAVRARWHVVNGHDTLAALPGESRMIAHLPFLEKLRDAGREQAKAWLRKHRRDVGRHSSIELGKLVGRQ